MEADKSLEDKNSRLLTLLQNQPEGHIRINAQIFQGDMDAKETRIGDHQIALTDEFMHQVKLIFGDDNVNLVYKDTLDNDNAPKRSKEDIEKERIRMKEAGDRTREQRHKEIASLLYEARSAMGM